MEATSFLTYRVTGAVTYTLPPAPINGNVLSVDAGGNMSWVAPASTAGKASLDVVTQATADTSKTILPVALGQSHFVHTLVGRITQVFDVDPLLTVGDSGDASKLVAATDYDLSAMSVGDVINIPFGDALAVGSALTAAYGAAPGTGSIKWSVVSVIV